jgi:hypothetical protein
MIVCLEFNFVEAGIFYDDDLVTEADLKCLGEEDIVDGVC